MGIVKVSEPSEIRDFIQFPFKLYDEDDSLWVPPMVSEMESNLDRDSHPFYEDSGSDARPFTFQENGKTRGRILAIESGP